MVQAVAGDNCCQFDCRGQALRIGLSLPGNIVCRSMIDGGSDYRQPQCDIDPVVEMQELEGDQTLVVVHADYCVIVSGGRLQENGVGRKGPLGLNAKPTGLFYGRGYLQLFFIAEETLFTRMRIKPGNRYPRRLDIEIRHQCPVGEADELEDRGLADPRRYGRQ